jgi:Flp pilus assembly protein TadD
VGLTTNQEIVPRDVTKPMQLVAAMLVFLIAVDGILLGAASQLTHPSWSPALLEIAAVAMVPFVFLMIFPIFKYLRDELESDEARTESRRLEAQKEERLTQLKQSLDAGQVSLANLVQGKPVAQLDPADHTRVEQEILSLRDTVDRLQTAGDESAVDAQTLLQLARGSMATQQWSAAAKYLDEYVALNPNDWEAQFSRGVAHANIKGGEADDLAAVSAYGEAIAHRPADIEANLLARLFDYRGAMSKRLRRFPEAEADLDIAAALATSRYEKQDIAYNLACVYAMTDRPRDALAALRSLAGTKKMDAVRAVTNKYFASLRDDPEFVDLVTDGLKPSDPVFGDTTSPR